MWISNAWEEYSLIDAAGGERLEKWGSHFFVRPDPTAIWQGEVDKRSADGIYSRSANGGGQWEFKNKIPQKWQIKYKDMKLNIQPMGFKHMGVFPEQAANWDWVRNQNASKILNLFAYTGAATVAAAMSGASVTHVDASKGIVQQAKENAELNGLKDAPIRYIVDDCQKFVAREIRRESKYDGIVLDPPSYGRGPNGEVFKLENELYSLLDLCKNALNDNVKFILLNLYTAGISPDTAKALMQIIFPRAKIESQELGLPVANKKINLPCGVSVRCMF